MADENQKPIRDFDLEQAVYRWKKTLRGLRAAQDGDVAELEGYLRDKVEDLMTSGLGAEQAFEKALAQFRDMEELDGDYFRARTTRSGGRPPWKPPRFVPALLWNDFKLFARKLKRQKVDSFIMLAGLTIGIAASFLILLYCGFERSYENFHRNGDRIFRVRNDRISALRHDRSAGCPPGLGPALKQDFAEVEDYARVFSFRGDPGLFEPISRTGGAGADPSGAGVFAEKRILFVDPAFLRIFSFRLVRGDADTALEGPSAIVLSESTAGKFFPGEDPIGRMVRVTTRFGRSDCRVSGVCRDVPANSHLEFDVLLSYQGLEASWPNLRNQTWSSNGFLTYILLSPSADPLALEAKFPRLIENYSLEDYNNKRAFLLQTLRSIHLNSRLRFEAGVNGDRRTVLFLEIIAVFILLIAWVNSINLATARSMQRGKEVCVRKTLGAGRRRLSGQFLFESLVCNLLGCLLAAAVAFTALPAFSRLVGKPLSPQNLGGAGIWMGLAFLTGALLSGLYPAFVLSSFRPSSALHGPAQGASRGSLLRKVLVVFQFAIAVLLIASTLIVDKQITFMRSRDIGTDLDRTLVLEIPRLSDSETRMAAAGSVLSGLASVQNAAFSTSVPGRTYANSISGIRLQAAPDEEGKSFFIIDVDEHFFRLFDIPILSGRSFVEGFASDRDAVVLNEEASALLGFEDPDKALLKNIVIFGDVFRIIGVARNHHHLSLREKIEPVIYMPLPMSFFNRGYYLSLKLAGPSLGPAVSAVAAKWKEVAPGRPFEYFFLDDEFNRQYDEDRLFGRVFGLASLLAVSISCLGLFGLAVFSAERRKREIGIRRVFGASIPAITAKLCGEFLRWVLLAGLIAWPVTWYVMHRWLGRFAYRTAVGLQPLVAALLLALATALATVSYKAVRSALANPVDSIRYE